MMAVHVVRDEKFRKEYEVTFSTEEIQKEKEAWILANAKDMKVDGFRPGKAPLIVLMKNYGDKAHEKAVNKLLKSNHDAIVEKHKLDGAELKKVDQTKQTPEEESYKMSFALPPEFDLIDLSKITVENLKFKLLDDQIAAMIETIQIEHGEKTKHASEENYAIQDGDIVSYRLEIYEKDKLIHEDKNGFLKVIIGISEKNPCVALIQKEVTGHKIGDTITIDKVKLKDVQGYFHMISGKTVKMVLEITEIVSVKKAALDEKLFEVYGSKNLDDLKALIANQISYAHLSEIETCHKRYVFDALDKAYTFELSSEEVEEEFNRVWNQFLEEKKDFEAKGKVHPDMEGKKEEEVKEEYKKVAARRIRLGYILAKIRNTEKVELLGEDIPNYVRKHIGLPGSAESSMWLDYMKNNNDFRQMYIEMMLEDKIVQLLHSKAKHKDVEVTRDELEKRLSNIMPE